MNYKQIILEAEQEFEKEFVKNPFKILFPKDKSPDPFPADYISAEPEELKQFLSSQISKALSEVLKETLLNTERVLPDNENQMDWCNGYNTCLNIVKANIKNLGIEIK